MKIIAVAALKGGVGKTNFVFNFSTILAFKGYKILAIDLDPQGNLSKTFKKTENLTKKLFNPNVNIEEENLITTWTCNNIIIDIISTNIAMTILEEELQTKIARETILKRTFVKNYHLLEKYDYIIFDTSPNISIINKNALAIADEIILISDNSIYSLEAIDMLTSNWEIICQELSIKNNINSIIINNFDHYRVSKDFVEFLQKNKKYNFKNLA